MFLDYKMALYNRNTYEHARLHQGFQKCFNFLEINKELSSYS